jgi:hypothetical protein
VKKPVSKFAFQMQPAALHSGLPGAWLDELFGRLENKGQGVRDLIRRSAGIPFGFMVGLDKPHRL